METRLVDSEAHPEDVASPALRPKSLDHFVGQDALKKNLRIFVQAAAERGEAMDHTLLHGPPGLGKTTLAQIIAHELGVNFKATAGPLLTKPGDLAAILTNLEPRDVLFVDEIHRLHPQVEEVLYPAMEDYKLDIVVGEGPGARSLQIDLPPFTLVGATTRAGLLSSPLRDRFGIPLRLEFYGQAELVDILTMNAKKLAMTLEDEGAREIARRCRGTPRIAGRLLRRVRDFAQSYKSESITLSIAQEGLDALQVDKQGLDRQDRKYLLAMIENYRGGPVGVETLSAALAEQRDVIEDVIEPYLLQQGFIDRTPRGRMATQKAYDHLGLAPPAPLEKTGDLWHKGSAA